MTKAEMTAELARLRREHEAMASTLTEVENYVPEQTMRQLRRHYMECIVAARDAEARS